MLPATTEIIIYRDNTCMLTVNVKFYCFVLFPNFALKQKLGQSYSNFSEERAVSVIYLPNHMVPSTRISVVKKTATNSSDFSGLQTRFLKQVLKLKNTKETINFRNDLTFNHLLLLTISMYYF